MAPAPPDSHANEDESNCAHRITGAQLDDNDESKMVWSLCHLQNTNRHTHKHTHACVCVCVYKEVKTHLNEINGIKDKQKNGIRFQCLVKSSWVWSLGFKFLKMIDSNLGFLGLILLSKILSFKFCFFIKFKISSFEIWKKNKFHLILWPKSKQFL